jgi:hypothetical protein
VLGAEWWGVIASSPRVRSGPDKAFLGEFSHYSVSGWGPKLVLYIGPERADLYLSVTPSITRGELTLGLPGSFTVSDSSTRNGIGLRLAVGKEWRLGYSRWGLGLAGQLVLSRNLDTGENPPTWSTVAFGLNASVTRN